MMQKNVAVPIAEIVAARARQSEISRLNTALTISQAEKDEKLAKVARNKKYSATLYSKQRKKLVDDYKPRIEALADEEAKADLQRELDLEIDKVLAKADADIEAFDQQHLHVSQLLTEEEKATALQQLHAAEEASQGAYGVMAMNAEEITQRTQDIADYEADQAANGYKRARVDAYPPVGDQLDVLWKALAAQAEGKVIPEDAADMLAAIQEVKQQHPKPEGK